MINRRDFLGITAGAGAALAFPPQLLRAMERQQTGKLLQRAIPSSGEMLPVISFAPRPTAPPGPGEIKPMPTDIPAAKEVLRTFIGHGGKVVDVLHGGPIGEQAARTAAKDLGIEKKLFWTTPLSVSIPVLPGYAGPPLQVTAADIRAAMDEKFAAFKVPMIDLVMVGAGPEVSTHIAVLQQMKKEGRIRYIGVHDLLPPANMKLPVPATQRLESIMRNEEIDFVATDYSVGDRRVEETLLPLAQARKIGFMAYFVFDRGRLFKRIGTTPLPDWAADFDAKTWAQFCLKYVLGHPAVVVAREGTTNAEHMLDNIGGGTGRVPNEAMRKRMAELVDALPPTPVAAPAQVNGPAAGQAPPAPAVVLPAAILDRYVGEYKYAVASQLVNIRRDGDVLRIKIQGALPEGAMAARSETSFALPWADSSIDFNVDASGKVTGAVVNFGPNHMALQPQAAIVLPAAVLDRYASEWKTPGGTPVIIRRDGERLMLKVGSNPEVPFIVRSATRLQDPRGPVFEFQVDGQGNVTGLILEQGNPVQRMSLTRVP
jgi:aryl-alcohol dehydrogenase-like predicted oxidoreductase